MKNATTLPVGAALESSDFMDVFLPGCATVCVDLNAGIRCRRRAALAQYESPFLASQAVTATARWCMPGAARPNGAGLSRIRQAVHWLFAHRAQCLAGAEGARAASWPALNPANPAATQVERMLAGAC